ncbi:hypothetical protein BDV19DRAFT_197080 [Aspergillus venezuelensis]
MASLFKLPTLASVLTNSINKTMVTTRSASRAKLRLAALPTELVIQIFQSAPSFQDAAKLATTCKFFHEIYLQHFTPIYEALAPICIIEHQVLRECLVDLGHISAQTTTITPGYAACITEGSRMGDTSVADYHTRMAAQPYHDPQISVTLSPTEKRRYLRAMYQIAGLLCVDDKEKERRAKEVFTLKDLFLVSDFLCIFIGQAIPDERVADVLKNDPYAAIDLQRSLRWERNKRFRELYDHRYRPIKVTPFEENGRYAWWCDRQQETFRSLLTGRIYRGGDGKVDMSKVRDDLWYDSGEE